MNFNVVSSSGLMNMKLYLAHNLFVYVDCRILASHGNKNKETVTVNYTINFFALFGTEYSFLHGPGTSQ